MALGSTSRIAWRNLGRNRKRTALALAAIGVAQLALVFTNALMHGYADAMIDAVTGPMLGHVQVHVRGWRDEHAMDQSLDRVGEKLSAIRRVAGVERASARVYAPALAARDVDGHTVVVIGLDPAAEGGTEGLLEDVPRSDRPGGRRVLVGAGLAQAMGLHRGDELAIVGQGADGSIANDLFTVAGTLSSSVELVQRTGVVMSLDAAQSLFVMPDQAHEIVVRGSRSDAADGLAASIARLPALRHTEVLPWRKLAPELLTLVELTQASSFIVLLLVFVAAAAGIANTMLMATFERMRELGMLLALGTTPRRIVSMVLSEAVVLGLLGVAIGTALGALLVVATAHSGLDLLTLGQESAKEISFEGMNYHFSIVPRIEAADIGQGVGAILVTAVVAAVWPAMHAGRLDPVEAMRT